MRLNKTQIEAIAEKAVRDLRAAFEEKCEKVRESYTPSTEYIHTEELFNKATALEEQLVEVREQIRDIRKLYNIGCWVEKDLVLHAIRDSELQLPTLNFGNIKEDIKTDLTIGTIDSSFDPYKFIEETVNKYVNS